MRTAVVWPGSVGAEQSQDGPAADLEVDVVEGERVAEALGEAVCLGCVRHGRASFVCSESMRARLTRLSQCADAV
jgi:hypothetical protein